MSKILHILATLLIIGSISGAVLFQVNEKTAPEIAKNNAAKLADDSKIVMPNAEKFEEVRAKIAPSSGGEAIDFVYYKALDTQGNLIGYIVASQGPGFQSTIKVVMGVSTDLSTITGARFTAVETPGFGDILQNEIFYNQFTDHCTNEEKQVTNTIAKPDNRPEDPNIETKSGATVSQWAAVRIVNDGLAKIKAVVGEEPIDLAKAPEHECCGKHTPCCNGTGEGCQNEAEINKEKHECTATEKAHCGEAGGCTKKGTECNNNHGEAK